MAPTEQHRPIRPKPALRRGADPARVTGGSFVLRLSELHFDRLAGGGQRLEIELDLNRDLLAAEVLRYSP